MQHTVRRKARDEIDEKRLHFLLLVCYVVAVCSLQFAVCSLQFAVSSTYVQYRYVIRNTCDGHLVDMYSTYCKYVYFLLTLWFGCGPAI